MSTNFPTSLDSYAAKTDGVDDVLAAHVNNLQDAIAAIETLLGTGGDISVVSGKWFRAKTDGSTGGIKLGSSGQVSMYYTISGGANIIQLDCGIGLNGPLRESGSYSLNGNTVFDVYNVSATGYGMYVQGGSPGKYCLSINDYAGIQRFVVTDGIQVGTPTGGDKGAGTANFAGDIYKNNTAYTSPDYAIEEWVKGRVEQFAGNPGAEGYRRMTLEEIEQHMSRYLRLPRITDNPYGIFERADIVLEKVEELFTYVIELNNRLKMLEIK